MGKCVVIAIRNSLQITEHGVDLRKDIYTEVWYLTHFGSRKVVVVILINN